MGRKSDLSIEQKEEICKLYNEGKSTVDIGIIFNKTASSIAGYLTRANIKLRSNKDNSRKYLLNEDFFENIDSEHKAYWLGFMYADGYITNKNQIGISLSINDIDHLEKFNSSIFSNYPIHQYEIKQGYRPGNMYCRVLMTSNKMYNDLIAQGCVENKTNIIRTPNISKEMIRHFIRGYLDGDGCITTKRKSLNHSLEYKVSILGTEELLTYIKNFIEDNDVAKINKFHKRKSTHIVSNIELAGNKQVKHFLDLIYKDSTVYLDRKHDKYIDLKSYYDSRAYQER